jgi:hypothetical protein
MHIVLHSIPPAYAPPRFPLLTAPPALKLLPAPRIAGLLPATTANRVTSTMVTIDTLRQQLGRLRSREEMDAEIAEMMSDALHHLRTRRPVRLEQPS